ncbi:MAG: TatD family deoxyribonuclease [Parcubacteria group bacterium]|nr:MAG: TatD family deoxyribonuclease [Parcubacteria group bacterium]
MIIDTHSHLNFNAYNNDLEQVIKRALDNDVWMINVGSQYATSQKAIEISQKYPQGVYSAVGLHPIHLENNLVKIKEDPEEIEQFQANGEVFDIGKYRSLAKNEKVKAIGEVGLDYYYKPKTTAKKEMFKEKQKEVLIQEITLAEELGLPVIFHCRMAHQDLLEILKSQPSKSDLKGVIHCFTGSWQEAEKYLEMGFYLGFNGIIFKLNLDEVIRKTPLDKILIETDCPYLTPPAMGASRNEPAYIKYTAEKIAQLKNLKFEELAEKTTENAKQLFKIQ